MVKVKYLGQDIIGALYHNEVYVVEEIQDGWFVINDEDGDNSMWPPEVFEVVEGKTEELERYTTNSYS